MENCIQCKTEFYQAIHPMAHMFVICGECHKKREEDIIAQCNANVYMLMNPFKLLDYK